MRLILAALVVLAALPAAAQQTIEYGGELRQYYIEPPRGPRPAPAIIVLHGGAGAPSRLRRITRFTLHEKGWAEIYPVGLDRGWNDGRRDADGKLLHSADDLGFLRALIGKLSAEGLIDPARVFLAGISNGGGMALRLICEAPGLAAGAAVVAMSLPEDLACAEGPPVPLMLIHGTADPLVPFGGGPVRVLGSERGRVLSARETAARLARRNGCGAFEEIEITDHYPDDGTRVRLHVYRGCTAPLRHYIVEGGGHSWPGNYDRRWVEAFLGQTSRDISATFEIEEFFTGLAR
jgi:polyhydroxybutyrate depolymerase